MKARESGMPDRGMWEKFFDPGRILAALGLDQTVKDVVEFGCGYGTFTIPAARVIKGAIYALDIEPEMIRATSEAAKGQKLGNVKTVLRDFIDKGSGLPDACVDYVMLFNILHLENPLKLLGEAFRILKKGGRVGIIHWNYDASTPRGPAMAIRPRPEQIIEWATEAGFVGARRFDLKPYHYGIVMRKEE